MKRTLLILLLVLTGNGYALDGREIMLKNFNSGTVGEWQTMSRMTLIDGRGKERVRTGRSVNRLQKNGANYDRLYRYFTPQDIQGTAVLVQEHPNEDDMWIYLPAMKKTRRITAGNKRDSFVGSDFSYGDVVSLKVDDYQHTLLGREKLEGVDCYRVESKAKGDRIARDTGYSRKVSWIRCDNFYEKRIDYYDEAGDLVKTQLIGDLSQIQAGSGKWIAMRREMRNLQSGHRTIIAFDRIESGRGIRDDLFSVRSLERAQ